MRSVMLAALLLMATAWAAHAQAAASALAIEAAAPDAIAGTLTISGTGFGPRPFVTLDLVPLNIKLALDQRIIAVVPVEMIPPGSYLLTVSRGSAPADTASQEVRIGDAPAASTSPSASAGSASLSCAHRSGPSPLPAPCDGVARVGDTTITMADVDREWQRTDPVGYLAASRQLYDARRRVLTDMVNNELLSREAASRGLTVDALLKEELPKRTVPLPDTSSHALYQSLGDRSRGATLDQLRPALREWLARKVEPELAKMTYIEELTKVSTRADTLLMPPRVRLTTPPTIRRSVRRRHRWRW